MNPPKPPVVGAQPSTYVVLSTKPVSTGEFVDGGGGGGGGGGMLVGIVLLVAAVASIVFFVITGGASGASPPPPPPRPPLAPSPRPPPQFPSDLQEVACDPTPAIGSIQTPKSGTQHTIVNIIDREYSTVTTGSFSLGSDRSMLPTDLILMSGAGKFILAIGLLAEGVGLQSTVGSICDGPALLCSMPPPFYNKFNIGNLTVGALLSHNTKLPDFMNAGSESVTMQAYSGSVPVSNELNPVMFAIVSEGRAVLDEEKFQMLTDLYDETSQAGYSNTNYLVVQYLLEYKAGKHTRNVIKEDLGLECDQAYDSETGDLYADMANVSSSYWTLDGVNYVDIVRGTSSATQDSLQEALTPNILKTAGPTGNLYCSTKSVADLLMRVVDGTVTNVKLSDLVTLPGSVNTVDGSQLKSVGAYGTGGAEARILFDLETTNAKYIVVGSFNSDDYNDGVPELLVDCF